MKKINKLFTKEGLKYFFLNIFIDFKNSLKKSMFSLRSHNTYHELLIFLGSISLFAFVLTKDNLYSTITVVSIILLLINYLVKVYRFGTKISRTKEWVWYKELEDEREKELE